MIKLFQGLILILLLILSLLAASSISFYGLQGSIELYNKLYNYQPTKKINSPVVIDNGSYRVENQELKKIQKEIALLLEEEKLKEKVQLGEYNKSLYRLPNIAKIDKLDSHFKLPMDQAILEKTVVKNIKKQSQVKSKTRQKINQIIVKDSAQTQKKEVLNKKLWLNVDLSSQRLKVYKDGNLLYQWKVSTGRRGYATPVGKFKPKYLTKMHYSRQYNNAPMPYSIFFHAGYAFHGTKSLSRLGRRASHGCVRLHPKHAKKLYHLVQNVGKYNATIEITH